MKKQEKILIVEDEMVISATIEETLEKIGYEHVESAYSAESALEMMDQNDYDVILMDVKLGGILDGIDVVNEIKKKKDVTVVYVTGNSDDRTVSKARTTLPSGFIMKPVTENNLKVQLDLLLFKEKQKKSEVAETIIIKNLYEGDCTGLKIVLDNDGTIVGLSPQIRKITGIPAYQYIGKNFATVGWEENLYKLTRRILNELRSGVNKAYYGNIYSPYLGERLVRVNVSNCGPKTMECQFTDITHVPKKEENGQETIQLAVATTNKDIMKGFSSISSVVPNIRVAAQLPDSKSLSQFAEGFNEGVIMMDVNLTGLRDILVLLKSKPKVKSVLLASPIIEQHKLDAFDPTSYEAFISKSADDATLIEMITDVRRGVSYEDRSFHKCLS